VELLVLAKEPVAGRVKTRLCPPCTPEEAARIAEAALADSLDAALGAGADRVLLALDGRPGPWLPPGVVVVDQGDGPLDRRLARAWSHVTTPALQIGMDTPQVSAPALAAAMGTLDGPGTDAVLGLAEDGGWWAVGLAAFEPAVFLGVPTSRDDTGRRQAARLRGLGRRTTALPVLRDVDTFDDALAVAALAPPGRFTAAVAAVAPVGTPA
jgi:hypothetical protein